MERKQLAEKIIDFFATYRLLKKQKGLALTANQIEKQLDDVSFVENLIHIVILKTKHIKHIDKDRLKRLLVALEKVRVDLEYDE